MTIFSYRAIRAKQSPVHDVLMFSARASDILSFAEIDRAGRSSQGALQGFQRPQIAAHVSEIRSDLTFKDAILPNPIVVAFIGNVELRDLAEPLLEIRLDAAKQNDRH